MIETSAAPYDVFVSFVQADRAWVEGYLLDALMQAGVRYCSEADFAPGAPRLLEFENAARRSRRTLLILSPAYLSDGFTLYSELLSQTYGREGMDWPVIPLILSPVALPLRLTMLTALDATDRARWPAVVEQLCRILQRPAPAQAGAPVCPYPGMMPFTEADGPRFYGRQREVEDMLGRLRLHPFLAVIGPSGCGKSSLVLAGLVPALRQSRLFGVGEWTVRVVRPGATPLATLRQALADCVDTQRWQLTAQDGRLLLIVDQCEELFTLAREDTVTYQEALLALARTGTYVVLTVRADFYPELMGAALWPAIQAHRVEVLPLTADGLRGAITLPARDVGVYVESALVERLVADAAGEPGALPFVQETLILLWERLERRFLPASAYAALASMAGEQQAAGTGGVTGLQVAMARRADAALAGLTHAQQAIARRIFLRLVQFGEGRADTRRQQPVAELRSAGDRGEDFVRTVDVLAAARLLTLTGEEDEGRSADIAHEALIQGWPTLSGWLAERREAELTRRRLEDKAKEWVRLGQGQGALLDAVELLEAERWLAGADAADLGYDEALGAMIEASQSALAAAAHEREAAQRRELALERRARRQLQWLAAGLGLIVCLGLGLLGYREWLRQAARLAGSPRPVPGLPIRMEAHEVTNGRWQRCVDAQVCLEPGRQISTYFRAGAADFPVTGIDAAQASQFCRWIGRRLPTAAEWQAAATHGGQTPWPWGAELPGPQRANLDYKDQRQPAPAAVGSSRGSTPEGIDDLIGNVAEWTASVAEQEPGQVQDTWPGDPATTPRRLYVKGGNYLTTLTGIVAGMSGPGDPAQAGLPNSVIGLRCVEP